MCPRPIKSEQKPKLVDSKSKFVKKVHKALSCIRQLLIRIQKIYKLHRLKESLSHVVCPISRNFECSKCYEKGDYAHSNKYCLETQLKFKEN